MGTTTVVSSTVYNLAGDAAKRSNFLQTLVAGAILGGRDLAPSIQQGYLNSPSRRFKKFNIWANSGAVSGYATPAWASRTNYNSVVGFVESDIIDVTGVPTDPNQGLPVIMTNSLVADNLALGYSGTFNNGNFFNAGSYPDQTFCFIDFVIGGFNPWYWAAQWISMNAPWALNTNWSAVADGTYVNYSFNGGGTQTKCYNVIITWADGSKTTINSNHGNRALGNDGMSPSGVGPAAGNTLILGGESVITDTFNGMGPTARWIYARYVFTPGVPLPDGTIPASTLMYSMYQFGTNNIPLLEEAASVSLAADRGFYPFIPVRANKKFLSNAYIQPAYNAASQAWTKAFNNRGFTYDNLISTLSNNSSLANIDYAYVVFGVALNAADHSCRKYIFKFFQNLMNVQPTKGHVTMGSQNPSWAPLGFDMRIQWDQLSQDGGGGVYAAADGHKVKVDSLWFETVNGRLYLVWQQTANSWIRLLFTNVKHLNYVYNANAVVITAADALADTSESGFIVPLEAVTYDSLSIVDATQMASACAFLVLNSYQQYKTHWYESGIFKVVLFIAAIVISAFTLGAGGVGLLGANISVGAAIGFTGTAAIIAGAAINAMAAMILTNLITTASVAVFGQQIGSILGIIASFSAISWGTAMQAGQALSLNWTSLMKATTLLQLTNVVGRVVQTYINGEMKDVQGEANQLKTQYNTDLQQISAAYAQLPGYDSAIDLSAIETPHMNGDPPLVESPDAFLNRTLMTGSDIAQLTMSMIANFPELTLSTNLPLLPSTIG